MKQKEKPIPHQHIGKQFDVSHSVESDTEGEAKKLFNKGVHRLVNVNEWHIISGILSSTFELTDGEGMPVRRPVQVGDHFKINIPGPGTKSGGGYDWVKVEITDDQRNPSAHEESFTLRVRPAPNPAQPETDDPAHFFQSSATSTFRVKRRGNTVVASIHSRNDIPNTSTEKISDNIRNSIIAFAALQGLSSVQWKSLVNGLISE